MNKWKYFGSHDGETWFEYDPLDNSKPKPVYSRAEPDNDEARAYLGAYERLCPIKTCAKKNNHDARTCWNCGTSLLTQTQTGA